MAQPNAQTTNTHGQTICAFIIRFLESGLSASSEPDVMTSLGLVATPSSDAAIMTTSEIAAMPLYAVALLP